MKFLQGVFCLWEMQIYSSFYSISIVVPAHFAIISQTTFSEAAICNTLCYIWKYRGIQTEGCKMPGLGRYTDSALQNHFSLLNLLQHHLRRFNSPAVTQFPHRVNDVHYWKAILFSHYSNSLLKNWRPWISCNIRILKCCTSTLSQSNGGSLFFF